MPQWEYCTLSSNGRHIIYTLYRQDGPHADSRESNEWMWASSIATLGLMGWEAINTYNGPNITVWFFRRTVHARNPSFTFPSY
jgi:hypothetical protein